MSSLKEIAVAGCEFDFENDGHSGVIVPVPIPDVTASSKVKTSPSAFFYMNGLVVSVTGGSNGTIVNATGTGVITATATKVKANGNLVLRVDDETADFTMTGFIGQTGGQTYTTKIYIKDAGQEKVKGV